MYSKTESHLITWFDAVRKNEASRVEELIKTKKFDIEALDGSQRTALHVAASHNAKEVMLVLLKYKANIEARISNEGTTPLLSAVASGRIDTTILLLKGKANFTAKDEDELTLMHWLADEDHLDLLDAIHLRYPHIIQTLINVQRWNGFSPLHMARSARMVKKLIALGAHIEAASPHSDVDTPLFEATVQNQFEVVVCLVRHGANILYSDRSNQTVFDFALKKGYTKFLDFFKEVLFAQDKSNRKKTNYNDNVTAALSKINNAPIDVSLIERHASLRVDLFFFTLIAYYGSGLTVEIETTNRQHGQGEGDTRGCHSAILPSLRDTKREYPSHQYNLRSQDSPNLHRSYYTSILDGTHFQNSLNLTNELDKSVNYFDSYYIEGKEKSEYMRTRALRILNRVSNRQIDPIEGINLFLIEMHEHFQKIKDKYFNRKELPSSPKNTRATIYAAQYKGTFFNACGFRSAAEKPTPIKVRDDYIQAQLPLSKEERVTYRNNPHLFHQDKDTLCRKLFLRVKEDMNLPSTSKTLL